MRFTSSTTRWLLPVVALAAISASCSDEPATAPSLSPRYGVSKPPQVPPGPPTDAGKPATISFVSSPTSLVVNTSGSLEVQMVDKKGAPLAGRPVVWSSANGGSFNPTQGVTDASGRASTTFTAGTVAGSAVVTATSGTIAVSATVTVTAGLATRMEKVGNEANGEQTFQCTPHILSVRVTDQYGNGVAGHTVLWYLTTLPSVITTTTTIAGGFASVNWSPITLGLLTTEATAVDQSDQPLTGSPVQFSYTIIEDTDPGACEVAE